MKPVGPKVSLPSMLRVRYRGDTLLHRQFASPSSPVHTEYTGTIPAVAAPPGETSQPDSRSTRTCHTAEEWLPTLAGWTLLCATGAARFRSRQPAAGLAASLDGELQRRDLDLPAPLAEWELLSVPVAEGHELGADERAELSVARVR